MTNLEAAQAKINELEASLAEREDALDNCANRNLFLQAALIDERRSNKDSQTMLSGAVADAARALHAATPLVECTSELTQYTDLQAIRLRLLEMFGPPASADNLLLLQSVEAYLLTGTCEISHTDAAT